MLDMLDWQLAMLLKCNFMQVTKAKQVIASGQSNIMANVTS